MKKDASNVISSLESISLLSTDEYESLRDQLVEVDAYTRSEIAMQLVNFINQKSKELLLYLAHDEDSIVRANAYDSLSVFIFPDVEAFLIRAVNIELDPTARNYVLLSLADISYALHQDYSSCMSLFRCLLESEKSPQCILSIYRGLYLMGDESVLPAILLFLNHKNYQVRCSTVSILHDLLTIDNKDTISEAIMNLKKKEKTRAVIFRIDSLFVNNIRK